MFIVPILFGLGCAAAMAVAAHSHDADLKLLSWALSGMWALSNLLWYTNCLVYLPAIDWIVGIIAIVVIVDRPQKWIATAIFLIILRLTLHVVDYLTSHAFLITYIHGLNATFALLLGTVFYVGDSGARDNLVGIIHRAHAWLRASFRASASKLTP